MKYSEAQILTCTLEDILREGAQWKLAESFSLRLRAGFFGEAPKPSFQRRIQHLRSDTSSCRQTTIVRSLAANNNNNNCPQPSCKQKQTTKTTNNKVFLYRFIYRCVNASTRTPQRGRLNVSTRTPQRGRTRGQPWRPLNKRTTSNNIVRSLAANNNRQ